MLLLNILTSMNNGGKKFELIFAYILMLFVEKYYFALFFQFFFTEKIIFMNVFDKTISE